MTLGALMEAPETRFARIGDKRIAYQVVGDGPIDLLVVSGWFSNVDAIWDEPLSARFLERLATFSRVILFDRRGTGASDPMERVSTTLEDWADDVRVVLDAAGSHQAALLAYVDGGRLAMLFAASFPDRVSALILANSAARFLVADDYPCGVPLAGAQRLIDTIGAEWGTGAIIDFWAPTQKERDEFRRWWSRYQRMSASPQMGQASLRMAIDLDVRHVLPSIQAPTLVLQRAENPLVSPEHGRYLASHIPDATYVELPGVDFFLWTMAPELALEEIEGFLTGVRPRVDFHRVLATVMFTDIVGSTERAVELGDREWTALLDRHHDIVRSCLRDFDGKEIDTAGDGFLATFDGPSRAIRCACGISEAVHDIGLQIRAGLHSGEIELRGRDIAGITVHIGARIAAKAAANEVLISQAVAGLVAGAGFTLEDKGTHNLKGVPGDWPLLAITTAS